MYYMKKLGVWCREMLFSGFYSRLINPFDEHQVNQFRIRMMELPTDLIIILSLQERFWFIAINP